MDTTTREDAATGQVSTSAAQIYDSFFVPALFGQFAGPVAEATDIGHGGRALDVACGTGALALALLARVGPDGSVTGLDRNPGMLAVARAAEPRIDWREGRAEDLPFEDAHLDAVACNFGLMFFEDRTRALAEMLRTLRPGGRLAVAVWAAAESAPGYAAMIALLDRLFGPAIAEGLRAPFVLGDRADFAAELARAGIEGSEITTLDGTARFPSIRDWVHTDVKGWTLADSIDDDQYATLQREAATDLARFAGPGGDVSFPAPAHLAVMTRPL